MSAKRIIGFALTAIVLLALAANCSTTTNTAVPEPATVMVEADPEPAAVEAEAEPTQDDKIIKLATEGERLSRKVMHLIEKAQTSSNPCSYVAKMARPTDRILTIAFELEELEAFGAESALGKALTLKDNLGDLERLC